MSAIEFVPWEKIPRRNRDIVVTEKLDGTNAAIVIKPHTEVDHIVTEGGPDGKGGVAVVTRRLFDNDAQKLIATVADETGTTWYVFAQSRTRFITPDADNFGFAKWVEANAPELVEALGEGRHFGEWWGQGIQRGYGLKEKRFSLFNVSRWYNLTKGESPLIRDAKPAPACCSVVPILYRGLFGSDPVQMALDLLRTAGSFAAPFNRPEGVVVYHEASGHLFKKTLVGDEKGKDQ